jgi:DNA-binding transcriptional LysR family regulator
MDKSFSQLVIFYFVVENMSFSKAAASLKCSKAYISKQISELEHRVGSSLLQRNTRSLALTFAGETLFEHAKLMVGEFRAAQNSIANLQTKAKGLLRITAPTAYNDFVLAPRIPAFLKEYPEITLEMNLTGLLLNLVEENIDVAIRLTHEPPLDRVAKRAGSYQMIICASHDYLARKGKLEKPIQLLDHDCLVYSTERNSSQWPFFIEKDTIRIEVKPRVTANSSMTLLQAVSNGMGIARLPDYVVGNAIQAGQLTGLLTDYYPPPIPIYAIYASARIIPPKIQAFIRFLTAVHQ